jgi:hypothetical protein
MDLDPRPIDRSDRTICGDPRRLGRGGFEVGDVANGVIHVIDGCCSRSHAALLSTHGRGSLPAAVHFACHEPATTHGGPGVWSQRAAPDDRRSVHHARGWRTNHD